MYGQQYARQPDYLGFGNMSVGMASRPTRDLSPEELMSHRDQDQLLKAAKLWVAASASKESGPQLTDVNPNAFQRSSGLIDSWLTSRAKEGGENDPILSIYDLMQSTIFFDRFTGELNNDIWKVFSVIPVDNSWFLALKENTIGTLRIDANNLVPTTYNVNRPIASYWEAYKQITERMVGSEAIANAYTVKFKEMEVIQMKMDEALFQQLLKDMCGFSINQVKQRSVGNQMANGPTYMKHTQAAALARSLFQEAARAFPFQKYAPTTAIKIVKDMVNAEKERCDAVALPDPDVFIVSEDSVSRKYTPVKEVITPGGSDKVVVVTRQMFKDIQRGIDVFSTPFTLSQFFSIRPFCLSKEWSNGQPVTSTYSLDSPFTEKKWTVHDSIVKSGILSSVDYADGVFTLGDMFNHVHTHHRYGEHLLRDMHEYYTNRRGYEYLVDVYERSTTYPLGNVVDICAEKLKSSPHTSDVFNAVLDTRVAKAGGGGGGAAAPTKRRKYNQAPSINGNWRFMARDGYILAYDPRFTHPVPIIRGKFVFIEDRPAAGLDPCAWIIEMFKTGSFDNPDGYFYNNGTNSLDVIIDPVGGSADVTDLSKLCVVEDQNFTSALSGDPALQILCKLSTSVSGNFSVAECGFGKIMEMILSNLPPNKDAATWVLENTEISESKESLLNAICIALTLDIPPPVGSIAVGMVSGVSEGVIACRKGGHTLSLAIGTQQVFTGSNAPTQEMMSTFSIKYRAVSSALQDSYFIPFCSLKRITRGGGVSVADFSVIADYNDFNYDAFAKDYFIIPTPIDVEPQFDFFSLRGCDELNLHQRDKDRVNEFFVVKDSFMATFGHHFVQNEETLFTPVSLVLRTTSSHYDPTASSSNPWTTNQGSQQFNTTGRNIDSMYGYSSMLTKSTD